MRELESIESSSLILIEKSFDEESHTEYRLAYHNFYVITRYNNSAKYARAVAELVALLKKEYRSKS